MKSLYDDIIERNFRTDGEGRTVYFAKGLTRPGYIIPNEEKKTEIKKILSRYASILFVLWFVGIFVISIAPTTTLIFMSLILILHFGWFRRRIDQAIVSLPVSDLNPKFDYTNMRIGIGFLVIFCIFIFGGILLFGIAKSGGVKGIIISLSLFLFILIVAMVGIYFFVMNKKLGKDK